MDAAIQSLGRPQARSIIDSLRDGVVPKHGAEFFTAGRERWLASIDEDLEDLADTACTDGRLRIINGRNGDGKTHLMHLIASQSLNANFAVGYLVVSKETPLYNWSVVYGAIGRSLITKGNPDNGGLRVILNPDNPDPAIAADYSAKSTTIRQIRGIDPNFAQAAYRLCTQQTANVDQDQDLLLLGAWLEGEQSKLRQLGISTTVDQTNGVRMLRSLVLLLQHFGFAGLVVLVDEVESILNLSKNRRRDSYQTLRLLVDRENTPAHVLIAASTTPPMFTDRERGMQTYPALWSRVQPAAQSSDLVNYRATLIDLTKSKLSIEEYSAIGSRIRSIHAKAYGWDASVVSDTFIGACAALAASNRLTLTYSATRVFVKAVVETLELCNQHPGIDVSGKNVATMFGDVDGRLRESEAKFAIDDDE
jgi:hypothetical protein